MAESVQSTLHSSRSPSHTVGLTPDRELTCRRKRSRFSPNTQPGPLPQSAPMAAPCLLGSQNSGYLVKLTITPFPSLTRPWSLIYRLTNYLEFSTIEVVDVV